MKAKFISESINFERGIDPMDSMKVGHYHKRQLEKARKELEILFNNIQKKYGGRIQIYKSFDHPKTRIVELIRASWSPENCSSNYFVDFLEIEGEYFYVPAEDSKVTFKDFGGRKSASEAANEIVAQWGGKQLVDQWGVKESINFERGLEPKRSMKVGKHRNDLFNEIPSISFIDAMDIFPELGSDNDRKILSLAANMLQVPEEEVRIAMDRDVPVYNDSPLMEEYISREWEYGMEDSLESGSMSFDLIGSSTGEIFVKDRRTDEFLYILGARS